MRKTLALVSLCAVFIATGHAFDSVPGATRSNPADIRCRVIEAHTSKHPAAFIILFHQENRGDQARLSAMLRAHSGEQAEVQVRGTWVNGAVIRMKGCFGRGLLVLPSDVPTLKDGDGFLLRFMDTGNGSGELQGHAGGGSGSSP